MQISLSDLPIDIWAANGILVFFISILITGILIPKILLISFRRQLFDIPDERKIHKGTVPRLGGMAFMPAIILAVASVTGLNLLVLGQDGPQVIGNGFGDEIVPICFGLCALMMMYLVGIADDLIGVKYRAKFFVQFAAALLIVASGTRIGSLGGFLGIQELAPAVATILTVIVIVFIINAVNLIDGIDGLASGLTAIACGFYALKFYEYESYTYAMIALATLGALIPFFYYNVYGNARVGKKIFMGDTGALTIGIILSILSIRLASTAPDDGGLLDPAPLVVAFSPLVVPCFDVLRVFFHRISRRQSPFQPGRTHIHHKFLALGLRQRYTMLLILLLSVGFIAFNSMLSPALPIEIILFTDLAIWGAGNWWLTHAIRARQKQHPEAEALYD